MALPATMTAIIAPVPGGPDALTAATRPLPQPAAGEILVRVRAAGVNRPDVMQRKGQYAPPPGASDVLGLELAGEVVALGAGASRHGVGDSVVALVAGGGYAEFAAVHETNALALPKGFSAVEGAAIPETFCTVWSNLFQRGGLKAGEIALVHGGASGIGTTAIQLARAFGARVFVTAGSAERCAAAVKLGAEAAFDYTAEDFVAGIKAATGGHGADVILDMIGGDYVARNYEAAAPDGRIVQIATQHGRRAEIDFQVLMGKRLTHTGSTLRSRPVAFKAGVMAGLREHVWPLLESRTVAPVIAATFPLERAAEAHAFLDGPSHFGKIVLTAG